MIITETQNPVGPSKEGKVRIYNIEGPSRETITDFWDWLKTQGLIKDFEISA